MCHNHKGESENNLLLSPCFFDLALMQMLEDRAINHKLASRKRRKTSFFRDFLREDAIYIGICSSISFFFSSLLQRDGFHRRRTDHLTGFIIFRLEARPGEIYVTSSVSLSVSLSKIFMKLAEEV